MIYRPVNSSGEKLWLNRKVCLNDEVSVKSHAGVCLYASSKHKKNNPVVQRMPQLCIGGSVTHTVEMAEIAFDEKENHLRVVCNVLWKIHNFCAFTSELSSCTPLRLWANWDTGAVRYFETVCRANRQNIKHLCWQSEEKTLCNIHWLLNIQFIQVLYTQTTNLYTIIQSEATSPQSIVYNINVTT